MASKFHNRTLTTLYHYWRARRQGETLPGRSDIDPADLDAAVPGLLLLDVQQRPPRFRYRRVGPALADLLGADPNGLCLDEVKANPLHDQMLGGLQTCAWQRRPVLVRGSFGLPRQRDVRAGGAMVRRSIANTFSGRQLVYEMLLVPMARDGRTVGEVRPVADFPGLD